MNPIMQALRSGYSSKQILNYVSRSSPELADKIKSAMSMGYSTEKILKYVLKEKGGTSEESLNEFDTMTTSIPEGIKRAGRLAATGIGVATGYGVGLELLNAAADIQETLPRTEVNGGENQELPTQEVEQTETETETEISPEEILTQTDMMERVNTLKEAGNENDVIGIAIEKQMTPQQKKWLSSQTKKPMSQIVQEYLSSQPAEGPTETALEVQYLQTEEEPEEIMKGSTMLTATGEIAFVEDMPGDTAKVKVDDKTKIMKSKDLYELPESEEDLADLYEFFLRGMENVTGEEVSRHVYWAGYDPKNNELAYIPTSGGMWKYDNIDKETAEKLKSVLTLRKGSGGNYIGPWVAGTKSPIGSQMSALIRKLQEERGGKGQEYSGKFETIHDAMEPGKLALKKVKSERKKEQKAREKKAKKSRSR